MPGDHVMFRLQAYPGQEGLHPDRRSSALPLVVYMCRKCTDCQDGGSGSDDRSYTSGTNPITGEPGRVTVTVAPGTTTPAPGTSGLFLRDAGGAVMGFMGEGDRARVLTCHPGNPNLVKVQQITGGHGGWGAYIGYVKIAATADPSSIGCG